MVLLPHQSSNHGPSATNPPEQPDMPPPPPPTNCCIIPVSQLIENDWLKFGCIRCIQDGVSHQDLLKPITITTSHLGFGSKIDGVCCNGHRFNIQTPSNPTRAYSNPSVLYNQPNRTKYISEDMNLLAVLATYLNGHGATEMKRIAAALNLKNYKTCHKMFHRSSKEYVGEVIINEARKVVKETLFEEMELSFKDHHADVGGQMWSKLKSVIIGDAEEDDATLPLFVNLVASTDMGWQKRSSGRRYDSPSGHMFFIGAQTNKIIDYDLMCVSCNICQYATKKRKAPKPHRCYKNFDGHAKAMEATTAAKLVTRISEDNFGKARISTIIADDDSSMRSHCSHQGGLHEGIHEPLFLADPSHRCKVIAKPLFKLASSRKTISLLTKSDALRIKVYLACFFNINRDKGRDLNWMIKHVWCVIHHLFDDHELCTSDFCWKKKATEDTLLLQQREDSSSLSSNESSNIITDEVDVCTTSKLHALRSKPGYYLSKEKDISLFTQLKETLENFFDEDSMKEIMHGFNTQTNEGLNTSVSFLAPKNRNYSSSCELPIRVALVAGCQNLGKYVFIKRVIDRLGFQTEPTAFLNLLQDEDKAKKLKQKNQSMISHKRRRVKQRVEKSFRERRKDVEAAANGTTYGNGSLRRCGRKKHPSSCPYVSFGCDTPGHTHKSIRSTECKYHHLYAKKSKDNKVSTKEWHQIVRDIWCKENNDETSRSKFSARDIVDMEFQGNIDLVSNRQTSTSSSTSNCDDDSEFVCRQITQDCKDSQSFMSSIEMFDTQNTFNESDDYGLDSSEDDEDD